MLCFDYILHSEIRANEKFHSRNLLLIRNCHCYNIAPWVLDYICNVALMMRKKMVSCGGFLKKITLLLAISLMLIRLRETFLSFDVRALHSLLSDSKISDYNGYFKGFFNLGEVYYNITNITLRQFNIPHSNVDLSNLWSESQNDTFVRISFNNSEAKLTARWSYNAWPSFIDDGTLTLEMHNVFVESPARLYIDIEGFVNITSQCKATIQNIDLQFYHGPNIMFESIKPHLKNKAERSLPRTLCWAVQKRMLGNLTSRIRGIQEKFVNLFFSGDVKGHENMNATLGWILVSGLLFTIKLLHNFGPTLLLAFTLLLMYLAFEFLKFVSSKARNRCFPKQLHPIRDTHDEDIQILTRVSVTVVSETMQSRSVCLANVKKILWWKKTKKN